MAKDGFLKRHGIVRHAIREDIIYFAIPAFTVFLIGLVFCAIAGSEAGLTNFWGIVWGLIKQPSDLFMYPMHAIVGLATVLIGLTIMITGQVTLWRNYSSTVVIREDHQLITHGIYRFTRNPIYLGLITAVIIGLPVFVASLYGFVVMLALIPIILNRIRLEERLLTEAFKEEYQKYKETTKRLIPFIY